MIKLWPTSSSVFTSGALREEDALPYRSTVSNSRYTDKSNALYFTGGDESLFVYDPQPEFRRNTREDTNRILANFRGLYGRRSGHELGLAAAEALTLLENEASSKELDFARRVLVRIETVFGR